MRIFKTKWFMRFARKEGLEDKRLCTAIQRAEDGLVDAQLSGDLIKQRVAREGQGRSGGYRTIIAYRPGSRAVFLYGFAKNERENIDDDELEGLRDFAQEVLNWSDNQVEEMIVSDKWKEIAYGGNEEG